MIEQPSYVVQVNYVPDPLATDSVTIGVIVLSHETTKWKFVSKQADWSRVENFGREPIEYVQDWLQRFEERLKNQSLMVKAREEDLQNFRKLSERFSLSSIQFSTPQAVYLELDATLRIYSNRLLRILHEKAVPLIEENQPRIHKTRILQDTEVALEEALIRRLNNMDAGKLVLRGRDLMGSLPHRTDFAIGNGHMLHAGFAVSFDREPPNEIELVRNNIFWAITDTRPFHGDLPMSVMVGSPQEDDQDSRGRVERLYRELVGVCERNRVEIVHFPDITAWANHTIDTIGRDRLQASLEERLRHT